VELLLLQAMERTEPRVYHGGLWFPELGVYESGGGGVIGCSDDGA
jgi:hypothetical protein